MLKNLPSFNLITSVHVELTDKCNAECPCCVRRINGGSLRSIIKNVELDVNYFSQSLGDTFCSKIQQWEFCGTKGDPIACNNLTEICKYLLSVNPTTSINVRTNGGFRSIEWWTELGNLFNNTNCEVWFGIDGLEDTNHLYRKNVKWSKVWENLMAYVATGAKTIWQFLPFEHNEHQQVDIENICKQYNITLFVVEPFGFGVAPDKSIHPINVYDRDDNFIYQIWPARMQQQGLIKGVLLPGIRKPVDDIDNSIQWLNVSKDDYDISCKINVEATNLYIDCNGAILPCCYIGAGLGYKDDKQLLETFKDIKKFIPTSENTVSKILNNEYFTQTLRNGITGDLPSKPVYMGKCIETCGVCVSDK